MNHIGLVVNYIGIIMGIGSIIFLVILIVAVGFIIVIYNNLVTLKHAVSKAWSNIDVLLKQRHDELPKLVEVCKQYIWVMKKILWKKLWKHEPGSQMPNNKAI